MQDIISELNKNGKVDRERLVAKYALSYGWTFGTIAEHILNMKRAGLIEIKDDIISMNSDVGGGK